MSVPGLSVAPGIWSHGVCGLGVEAGVLRPGVSGTFLAWGDRTVAAAGRLLRA